jgi:hypothetical protein
LPTMPAPITTHLAWAGREPVELAADESICLIYQKVGVGTGSSPSSMRRRAT